MGPYPSELVQRRIQVQGMKAGAPAYKNMLHGIFVVAKNEGEDRGRKEAFTVRSSEPFLAPRADSHVRDVSG